MMDAEERSKATTAALAEQMKVGAMLDSMTDEQFGKLNEEQRREFLNHSVEFDEAETEYRRLACKILGLTELDERLMTNPGFLYDPNIGDLTDRDDQRLNIECGGGFDEWSRLNIDRRIVLMEAAAAKVAHEPPTEATDCDAEMKPYLDRQLTVAEIATMAHMAAGSIKSAHKKDWGKPKVPARGSRPAKWLLRNILPILKTQFPKLRPPEDPKETD